LSLSQRELIRFVERDFEVSNEAAGHAQTAVVASRSVGFTLLAALLGLGLLHENWLLLLAAAVSGCTLYLIDAYYTWRARERELYIERLDAVLSAYYATVQRAPGNQRDLARLDLRLATLRTGSTSQISRLKRKDLLYIQPSALFLGLYPLLLCGAIAAAIVFFVEDQTGTETHPVKSHAMLVAGGRPAISGRAADAP
jgi:hypothetical protein